VSRCGLCGTDIHIFKGHYSADRLPLVPGHEFSGHVAQVGANVTDIGIGTPVTADINLGCGRCFYCRKNEILNCASMVQIGIHVNGGLAEYVRVPASHVVPIPPPTSIELAALTEPVSCIVRAIKKSRLRLGESVLVLGAGPIGNLHIQLARQVGAAPVIVSEPNEGRAQWARQSGADVVVTDAARLHAAVMAATEGRGADLVIESVGLPVLYEQALDLVRPGGRVLASGRADQGAKAHYHPFKLVLNEIGLQGSVAGMGDDMREAMTLIAHDRVRLNDFVETVYPLEHVAEAMEAFVSDRSINKVQIAVQ
jgi:2-desacetyl-2-hydroxyethyl bacteriochlorophyllide A dehydrogenase